MGLSGPGGDRRRHRVGRVVEAIREVERNGGGDGTNSDPKGRETSTWRPGASERAVKNRIYFLADGPVGLPRGRLGDEHDFRKAADGRELEVALAGPPDGRALFSHHGTPGRRRDAGSARRGRRGAKSSPHHVFAARVRPIDPAARADRGQLRGRRGRRSPMRSGTSASFRSAARAARRIPSPAPRCCRTACSPRPRSRRRRRGTPRASIGRRAWARRTWPSSPRLKWAAASSRNTSSARPGRCSGSSAEEMRRPQFGDAGFGRRSARRERRARRVHRQRAGPFTVQRHLGMVRRRPRALRRLGIRSHGGSGSAMRLAWPRGPIRPQSPTASGWPLSSVSRRASCRIEATFRCRATRTASFSMLCSSARPRTGRRARGPRGGPRLWGHALRASTCGPGG